MKTMLKMGIYFTRMGPLGLPTYDYKDNSYDFFIDGFIVGLWVFFPSYVDK